MKPRKILLKKCPFLWFFLLDKQKKERKKNFLKIQWEWRFNVYSSAIQKIRRGDAQRLTRRPNRPACNGGL